MFVDRVRVPLVDHFVEPLILNGPAAVAHVEDCGASRPSFRQGRHPYPVRLLFFDVGRQLPVKGFRLQAANHPHGLATLDDGLGLAITQLEDGLNNMAESPPCNGDNLGVLRRCIKDESVGAPDGRSG